MGTLLPLSGNLTTSDIAKYWENCRNYFGDLQAQLNKLDDLIIEYNKNKLSDEFFQFDIIKLNQNN